MPAAKQLSTTISESLRTLRRLSYYNARKSSQAATILVGQAPWLAISVRTAGPQPGLPQLNVGGTDCVSRILCPAPHILAPIPWRVADPLAGVDRPAHPTFGCSYAAQSGKPPALRPSPWSALIGPPTPLLVGAMRLCGADPLVCGQRPRRPRRTAPANP
jgi:hypothetical protein